MTKQALTQDMKRAAGGASFITVTQLAAYLGRTNKSKVKYEYLADLDRVGNGYFIPDVAEMLMQKRRWNG